MLLIRWTLISWFLLSCYCFIIKSMRLGDDRKSRVCRISRKAVLTWMSFMAFHLKLIIVNYPSCPMTLCLVNNSLNSQLQECCKGFTDGRQERFTCQTSQMHSSKQCQHKPDRKPDWTSWIANACRRRAYHQTIIARRQYTKQLLPLY